jgi:hypothetical protein
VLFDAVFPFCLVVGNKHEWRQQPDKFLKMFTILSTFQILERRMKILKARRQCHYAIKWMTGLQNTKGPRGLLGHGRRLFLHNGWQRGRFGAVKDLLGSLPIQLRSLQSSDPVTPSRRPRCLSSAPRFRATTSDEHGGPHSEPRM